MEVRVDLDEDSAVTDAVVRAIAQAEGVPPTELSPPLYESANPEALDSLFAAPLGDVRVSFFHCGYEVAVESDGRTGIRLLIEEARLE